MPGGGGGGNIQQGWGWVDKCASFLIPPQDNIEVCSTLFLGGSPVGQSPSYWGSNPLINTPIIPIIGFSLFPASLSSLSSMCFLRSPPKYTLWPQDLVSGSVLSGSQHKIQFPGYTSSRLQLLATNASKSVRYADWSSPAWAPNPKWFSLASE